jgi:beta-ring hydroxylase
MPNEVTEGYRYLPFGGGRRKCVGDQFALFEAVVGLSMLLRRFEFERAPDAPPVGMTTGGRGCMWGRWCCAWVGIGFKRAEGL